MDKYLKPDRFDAEPSSQSCAKDWLHCYKTFENFLTAIPGENHNKLNILINFVSPKVYEYIEDCTEDEAAINILKSVYVKTSNKVNARHLLSTRKELVGESIDTYVQTLRKLSKNCNFQTVSQ